jgi:peptide/nickel transport system substrate-binding protein
MFQKPIVRTLLFLVIIASFLLAGCAQPAAPTQAPAPAEPTQPPAAAEPTQPPAAAEPTQPPAAEPTSAAAPAEKKVATFIWTQEFDTLNPIYTNMWFSTITHQWWNCWAWDFDDKNAPRPVLVKEMPSLDNGGISADGKTLTLKLREDLVWSDGTPLTADDFIFTYNMIISPKNAVSGVSPYDKLDKIEAPDPQTVVMTFKDPYAPWVGTLWHGILPKHILQAVFDKDGTLDKAEWSRTPTVGCGPFVFTEWESGSFARFTANEKYWTGRPKLDEIFVRFVPDDASQIAALKTGDGDLGTFFAYSDMPDLEKAGVTLIKTFSGYNEGIYFLLDPNKTHPALLDVKVRQAIAYATNRQKLTEDLLLGKTAPAATMWDNTPYVDPSITPYAYDVEKAKALLDEAGWVDSNGDGTRDKDGTELALTYGTTTREIRQDTQAVLQQELAEVGIKVELQNFDSDIYFAGYGEGGPAATGQLDIFEYSTVTQFPDPDTYDFLCTEIPSAEKPAGTNWEGWCDPDLDALFQKQTSEVDFATRQQTFYQISKMIYDKVYWLGFWQDPDWFGISARLLNVKLSGATPFYNIAEWDLK